MKKNCFLCYCLDTTDQSQPWSRCEVIIIISQYETVRNKVKVSDTSATVYDTELPLSPLSCLNHTCDRVMEALLAWPVKRIKQWACQSEQWMKTTSGPLLWRSNTKRNEWVINTSQLASKIQLAESLLFLADSPLRFNSSSEASFFHPALPLSDIRCPPEYCWISVGKSFCCSS